jgi:ABC-type xylose transport system permease subunit
LAQYPSLKGKRVFIIGGGIGIGTGTGIGIGEAMVSAFVEQGALLATGYIVLTHRLSTTDTLVMRL